MKEPKKAGRKASGDGNVVIDLGEKIEAQLRQTSMAGQGGNVKRPTSSRPGSSRSGAHSRTMGGYRPWYASRWSRMGAGKSLTTRIGLPETTRVPGMMTGTLVGIGVNRTLLRLSPLVIDNKSQILHDAIAFVAGLVPYLARRNSPVALGVAIPGLVVLGGSMFDALLDYVGLEQAPGLSGSRPQQQTRPGTTAARQKLNTIQNRINQPRGPVAPRVVARPSYA